MWMADPTQPKPTDLLTTTRSLANIAGDATKASFHVDYVYESSPSAEMGMSSFIYKISGGAA
jgi:hypothetical protein